MNMLPGLMTDMGGFDYRAIETVFEIEQVDQKHRKKYFDQILKLINVIKKEREKRREEKNGQGQQLEPPKI